MACQTIAFARAGLIGNPSDGYFGKTISFVIRDFFAKVSVYENAELEIVPSFQDRSTYRSIDELVRDVREQGYYGGVRLMKAAIRKFADYCAEHGISLPDRNFSMRYRSTIPRRVGMAGSSALVTAAIRALMEHYHVDIPLPVLPNLVLSVENEELNIAAGLQDRVIQAYEGCVFMDFAKETMDRQGHGDYERLDPGLLPNLFIAYRTDLAEGSEVVHNNIRQRWLDGDPEVIAAMKDFAGYAQQARDLLVSGRGGEIGPLLDKNFNRRRALYQIDSRNIEMVERARSVGACCKFAGSGGTIVGTYADEEMFERLQSAFANSPAVVLKPTVTEH